MPIIQCLIDQYEAEHVALKTAAPDRVKYAMKSLSGFFGGKDLSEVNIPLCRQYAQHRGVRDGTIRYELGILKAALSHAVRWGRLSPAEVPFIELPAAPQAKQRWLTREELERLLAAAEQRTQDYINLMYFTASRKGAIELLTPRFVDLENWRIDLNSDQARTKKRRPIVPVGDQLKPILERLCAAAETPDSPLLGEGSLRYGFERAVAAAGLDGVTPHVIRHTRITHLLQSGARLWDVASLAGDNVTTIERVYGHHCPEYLESALKSFM